MLGTLKFYSETKKVFFPIKYDEFKSRLSIMLSIEQNSLSNLKITYNDSDGDSIVIFGTDDYEIFIKELKTRSDIILSVEITDEDKINKLLATQSIVGYIEPEEEGGHNAHKLFTDIFGKNPNTLKKDKNNIIRRDKNQNEANNNNNEFDVNKKVMNFPVSCSICSTYPIINILYYCAKCQNNLCENCERKFGPQHRHSLMKIQSNEQYEDLTGISGDPQNNNDSKISEYVNKAADKIEKGVSSIIDLFKGDKKDDNIDIENNIDANIYNPQNPPQNRPQQMTLIQVARMKYDLSNVSDQQIEEALKKTKGNIDDAVIKLTTNIN